MDKRQITAVLLAAAGTVAGLYVGESVGVARGAQAVMDELRPALDENAERILELGRQLGELKAQVTEARRLLTEVGDATFYGEECAGKPTANGEPFDPDDMTAASWRWPFGTMLRVTSLDTGKTVTVRANDRGPHQRIVRTGVVIDLSRAAAERLGMIEAGRHRVMVTPVL